MVLRLPKWKPCIFPAGNLPAIITGVQLFQMMKFDHLSAEKAIFT